MRIGCDVDGVLADFVHGYNELANKKLGITLEYPATQWKWYGDKLTDVQVEELKKVIHESAFHVKLLPLPGALDALERLNVLSQSGHQVYFITNRSSPNAKQQTEWWLQYHGMDHPTVLCAEHKGPIALGLKLDVFVDDKAENNYDVLAAVGCQGLMNPPVRVYLVDQLWNQWADQPLNYGTRVKDLNEVLDIELAQGERKAA